jgi:hypothetical protein
VHNITRNLEVEFNEAELLPKTKEATIMAAAAYIAANAPNDDEHMRHLRNLALEGLKWWNLSTGNFDTAWLRTESTQHVHDAMRIASRTNVSWKHLAVIATAERDQT